VTRRPRRAGRPSPPPPALLHAPGETLEGSVVLALMGLLGAGCAAGSLALARRAPDPVGAYSLHHPPSVHTL
jgi:hypothetical protein